VEGNLLENVVAYLVILMWGLWSIF